MALFERIDSIYVPVSDLQASVVWYIERLGLKLIKSGKGYARFEVYEGETKLTLVETRNFSPNQYIDEQHMAPYFNFHTLDFERTCEQLGKAGVLFNEEKGNEYIKNCELTDPDRNWLGVCYEKENSPYFKPTGKKLTLFDRVGAVFIPVRDLQKSLDWYVHGLGLTLYHHWSDGADLGVNGKDNLITLLLTKGENPGQLEDAGRSYFSFFSADLELTRSQLEKQGITSTGAVEEQDFAYCRLTDPDGHGLLVISAVKTAAAK